VLTCVTNRTFLLTNGILNCCVIDFFVSEFLIDFFLPYVQFSYELYKLFINMNTTIHLGFKCEQFRSGLYVRALPVYCESEAFQVPVDRCIVHRCPGFHQNTGNSNIFKSLCA
jgi:hypothetical protein